MTALVFGGFPLAACHVGRVAVRPAFRIPASAPAVFIAAAVIGLSFWILSHEAVVLLHDWRDVALTPALVETLKAYADRLRAIPAPLVVLTMAVTPALFEEAFFRGYLFAALRSRMTPATTIVTTAIVFGLFHVVAPNPLASERLVSSTLVGLMLGWVRWRTGSLLPGMLLHTIHNGFVILVAYYEPQLVARGIGIAEQEHLPTAWLAAGALAVTAGAIGMYAATKCRVSNE